MESLKIWFKQISNSLTYNDLTDSQAKSAVPVTCIPEKPVQQWTFTQFFIVIPLYDTIIDLTSHRVIVRHVPSFFTTIFTTFISALAFAGFSVGFGAEWWAFLYAAIGGVLGFLAAFRMLVVRTWIATIQDVSAIKYGASAGSSLFLFLFVFVCFYAGGLLATNNNEAEAIYWGLTAIAFMYPFRVIFRQTKINLTIGGRVSDDQFEFPIDPFDMEHFRAKFLENKLALDYGTELSQSSIPAQSTSTSDNSSKRSTSYQGFEEDI